MKPMYLIPMLMLSGCVNLEFPGLIADTAKVSKEAYASVVGKKEPQDPAKPATVQKEYISNAYIGLETQTVTEIKQQCVREAAEKLFKITGKEVRYTVIENAIATVNSTIVANCKLAIDKNSLDSELSANSSTSGVK
jgi:hypothetical protein